MFVKFRFPLLSQGCKYCKSYVFTQFNSCVLFRPFSSVKASERPPYVYDTIFFLVIYFSLLCLYFDLLGQVNICNDLSSMIHLNLNKSHNLSKLFKRFQMISIVHIIAKIEALWSVLWQLTSTVRMRLFLKQRAFLII